MTQYNSARPAVTAAEDTAVNTLSRNNTDQELRDLRSQVQRQQDEIIELQRTMRKLKNELRVAINAFNLKNNG